MLLFEEDLVRRNKVAALYLRGQAYAGLERYLEAVEALNTLLALDRNHSGAMDLLHRFADAIRMPAADVQ